MATEQKAKDKGWGRVRQLLHSLIFLDWLVIAGFLFSIAVMVLSVHFTSISIVENANHITLFESNPITDTILNGNCPHLIWLFGIFWGVVFTAYYKFREKLVGTFLAFYVFSMYLFNFAHDITWVMVVMIN